MTRAEILETARQAVTIDRAATHGNAEDGFGLIAAYWSAHLECTVKASDVAVMMVLLKLARIKANSGHSDSWVDVCGYAACGGEIATKPTTLPDEGLEFAAHIARRNAERGAV